MNEKSRTIKDDDLSEISGGVDFFDLNDDLKENLASIAGLECRHCCRPFEISDMLRVFEISYIEWMFSVDKIECPYCRKLSSTDSLK
ncbi:MAG: hypothetical protein IJH00_05905 [Erysipelotrichaceae bacterium]|nr:hypothetical protein [Erysipelotrichaceae bacterium]